MKIKTAFFAALVALGLGAGGVQAGEGGHVEDFAFPFEGPFGVYDQAQLRRGLKVYLEVCSACHGLKYVPFRALGDEEGPGLSEKAVKAIAANYEVEDPETGEMRPAKPTDHFPPSNDPKAPDLSLMAKARAGFHGPMGLGINQLIKGMGGPEYIASILTGFTGEEKEEAGTTFYENKAFPSGWISMPPPLSGDDVEYADGTKPTLEQEAKDVAAFLMWAAEPKLVARKRAGFVGVVYLAILASLLYLSNKLLWAAVKRKREKEAAGS